MVVKINILYNTEAELRKVLKALSPIAESFKMLKTVSGATSKAYIEVKV